MSSFQKAIYGVFLVIILFCLGLALISCGNQGKDEADDRNDPVVGVLDEFDEISKDVRKHNKAIRNEVKDIHHDVKKHNKHEKSK